MTLSRRRFLCVSAALLAAGPVEARAVTWSGTALGAGASITIRAPTGAARHAIRAVRRTIARAETVFSLHDPASDLSRLNRDGVLHTPSPEMLEILAVADRVHRATGGRFDPTVQPLWAALAYGHPTRDAKSRIGWDRVRVTPDVIRLGAGQALTLNGIAQGYATDMVAARLRDMGFTDVLVDMGEFAALGGPWRVGVQDPVAGLVALRRLEDQAIATSSPGALTLFPGQGHILDPGQRRQPVWSTVSVMAPNASLADGLSTGLCLLDLDGVRRCLRMLAEPVSLVLVSRDRQVQHLP